MRHVEWWHGGGYVIVMPFAAPSPTTAHPLARPLTVGSGAGAVRLPNRVFLAPMSGVSDLPFRRIASREGAGLVVSEMVASRELAEGHAESESRMAGEGLPVHAVQLAGRTADWMEQAARVAERAGAHLIDINMGCPAKKVVGGRSGSALMRDLDHALTLIEATVRAVRVPVTLKMRLGWDADTINAPELARCAEAAGVAMVTVHGRTRCQFYEGEADWGAVRAVRQHITIPLVVNGDITDRAGAERALALSGADAVMIGRGAYGRPWWPGRLAAELAGRNASPEPAALACEHYEALIAHHGPSGVRHARKHVAHYFDRWGGDDTARRAALSSNDPAEVLRLLDVAIAPLARAA